MARPRIHPVNVDDFDSPTLSLPEREARGLIPLLRLRGESIESLRRLIEISELDEQILLEKFNEDCKQIREYRQKVRIEFERLVATEELPQGQIDLSQYAAHPTGPRKYETCGGRLKDPYHVFNGDKCTSCGKLKSEVLIKRAQ